MGLPYRWNLASFDRMNSESRHSPQSRACSLQHNMPPRPRSMKKKNPAPVSPWSALAGAMLAWSMVRSYLLPHEQLRSFAASFLRRHAQRLLGLVEREKHDRTPSPSTTAGSG
jgi:hypothetical protein